MYTHKKKRFHKSPTGLEGYSVGCSSHSTGLSGCTVVLCPDRTTGGVCICGGAPAARELSVLGTSCLRSSIDAVLITGGSVYGLSAVDGVYRYLQEKKHCSEEQLPCIPIVPTAAIFDLRVAKAGIFPGADDAYMACCATKQNPYCGGSVGAGTGATVGKIRGIKWATKGGIGSANLLINKDITISVLAVVNAFGDIKDPRSGKIIAGARDENGFIDTAAYIKKRGISYLDDRQNTTICVVATNANLNKAEVNKVAQMASAGIARVISPCWTEYDGDIVIALAGGQAKCDYNLIGILAAELVAEAIIDAITSATSLAGIPSASELAKKFIKR